MRDWNTLARNREARLARAAPLRTGKVVAAADAGVLLERVLEAGDRVCLEGNNQKQADRRRPPSCRVSALPGQCNVRETSARHARNSTEGLRFPVWKPMQTGILR